MFILAHLRDAVKIVPEMFDKEHTAALTAILNEKYSGRVLPKVGYCVQVFEITSFSDAVLHPGEGASYSSVHFRLIVFKPFEGEILEGKVVGSDEKRGVRISLGFFDKVWVPPSNFRQAHGQKAVFDPREQLWTNEEQGEEDEEPIVNYIELGQMVSFRVVSVDFERATEEGPRAIQGAAKVPAVELPISIEASFADDGLGPVIWW